MLKIEVQKYNTRTIIYHYRIKPKCIKHSFLAISPCEINNGDCQHGAQCNVVNQQVLCNCQSGLNGPQCQFGKIQQIKRDVTNISLIHIFLFC